jgi:hypothetical protein
VSRLAELAALASLQPRFLGAKILGRGQQVVSVERQALAAQITMEAQRGGEGSERVGQRRARIVAQRTARRAG